jgi:ubiquinone/menaquinone biosynthesis C-methylase UbiE
MKASPKVIIDPTFSRKVNGSFYDKYYFSLAKNSVLWRDFGAIEKCKSITYLCGNLKHDTVVEFGCGTCSNLKLLDRNNFSKNFSGLEVSPSAVQYIKENVKTPHLKSVYLVDTEHTPFEDNYFDLGIVSHVVEHVPNPCSLIKEALRTCKHVVVEVPLDTNLSTTLYDKLLKHNQLDNSSGHIHFFTKQSFRKIIQESGGQIIKDRLYRPWSVFYTQFSGQVMVAYLKSLLFLAGFKVTGSYVVGTHYAVLIKKKLV